MSTSHFVLSKFFNNARLVEFTVLQLLSRNTQLGAAESFSLLSSHWFVQGIRQRFLIIDLRLTLTNFRKFLIVVESLVNSKRNIIFINDRSYAKIVIADIARSAGEYFITEPWMGGLLTNFKSILSAALRLQSSKLSVKLGRRTRRILSGLSGLRSLPSALFFNSAKNYSAAIREARLMKIPTAALVDTDTDGYDVLFPIPGNDESFAVSFFFSQLLAKTIILRKIFRAGRYKYWKTDFHIRLQNKFKRNFFKKRFRLFFHRYKLSFLRRVRKRSIFTKLYNTLPFKTKLRYLKSFFNWKRIMRFKLLNSKNLLSREMKGLLLKDGRWHRRQSLKRRNKNRKREGHNKLNFRKRKSKKYYTKRNKRKDRKQFFKNPTINYNKSLTYLLTSNFLEHVESFKKNPEFNYRLPRNVFRRLRFWRKRNHYTRYNLFKTVKRFWKIRRPRLMLKDFWKLRRIRRKAKQSFKKRKKKFERKKISKKFTRTFNYKYKPFRRFRKKKRFYLKQVRWFKRFKLIVRYLAAKRLLTKKIMKYSAIINFLSGKRRFRTVLVFFKRLLYRNLKLLKKINRKKRSRKLQKLYRRIFWILRKKRKQRLMRIRRTKFCRRNVLRFSKLKKKFKNFFLLPRNHISIRDKLWANLYFMASRLTNTNARRDAYWRGWICRESLQARILPNSRLVKNRAINTLVNQFNLNSSELFFDGLARVFSHKTDAFKSWVKARLYNQFLFKRKHNKLLLVSTRFNKPVSYKLAIGFKPSYLPIAFNFSHKQRPTFMRGGLNAFVIKRRFYKQASRRIKGNKLEVKALRFLLLKRVKRTVRFNRFSNKLKRRLTQVKGRRRYGKRREYYSSIYERVQWRRFLITERLKQRTRAFVFDYNCKYRFSLLGLYLWSFLKRLGANFYAKRFTFSKFNGLSNLFTESNSVYLFLNEFKLYQNNLKSFEVRLHVPSTLSFNLFRYRRVLRKRLFTSHGRSLWQAKNSCLLERLRNKFRFKNFIFYRDFISIFFNKVEYASDIFMDELNFVRKFNFDLQLSIFKNRLPTVLLQKYWRLQRVKFLKVSVKRKHKFLRNYYYRRFTNKFKKNNKRFRRRKKASIFYCSKGKVWRVMQLSRDNIRLLRIKSRGANKAKRNLRYRLRSSFIKKRARKQLFSSFRMFSKLGQRRNKLRGNRLFYFSLLSFFISYSNWSTLRAQRQLRSTRLLRS